MEFLEREKVELLRLEVEELDLRHALEFSITCGYRRIFPRQAEDIVDTLAGHIVRRALEATPAVSVSMSSASRLT